MSADPTLLVLANPECPHCLRAVDAVTDWALAEHLPVAGVDVRQHPEYEATWSLETSPVLVFRSPSHEDRVCVGMPDRAEFARLAQEIQR